MQPPASLKALADPIYEAFYGLTEQPFAITTDPKFFYLGAAHQRAFGELLNGLKRREAILLVTGETGTGKTTLARAVLEALGDRTFSALILNPYMSGAEVYRIILRDFGLVSHEDLRRGSLANADIPQLLDTLEGFLRSLVPLGSHAVIIVDEAQSLAPLVLDQIRLLAALEQNGHRLVQIILCGQPALLNTLKTEAMYALNDRITRRVALQPMPAAEVADYIQHRLTIAGGSAVTFDPAAAKFVAGLSHGVPRRINVLCDRALQEGRIEGVNVITPDLVKRAARSLAGVHETPLIEQITSAAPTVQATPAVPDAPAVTAAPVVIKAPEAPVAPAAETDGIGAAIAAAEPAARTMMMEDDAIGLLTFGQTPPATGGLRRVLLTGIGAIITALLLGYGYYAYITTRSAPEIPRTPARPTLDVGLPAGPLAVPSDDDLNAMFGPAATSSGQLPN